MKDSIAFCPWCRVPVLRDDIKSLSCGDGEVHELYSPGAVDPGASAIACATRTIIEVRTVH